MQLSRCRQSPLLSTWQTPFAPNARSAMGLRRLMSRLTLRNFKSAYPEHPWLIWLYHPAFYELATQLLPDAPVVYDVMDRFAAFHSSSQAVSEQEDALLQKADVVFTGGHSLDRAVAQALSWQKRTTHCFPSGVDLSHFGTALHSEGPMPPELAALPRPIYGYIGAVDERLDFDLLSSLAKHNPAASVVLIGPTLTTPAIETPSNIHFLGPRTYATLPEYLRGFDVCLLPFKKTELVAHVSPTKTPEYLAAGKPVVSTSIPDVVADYGDTVFISDDPERFSELCAEAAAHPPSPAVLHSEATRRARTWDRIAVEMAAVLETQQIHLLPH